MIFSDNFEEAQNFFFGVAQLDVFVKKIFFLGVPKLDRGHKKINTVNLFINKVFTILANCMIIYPLFTNQNISLKYKLSFLYSDGL